MSILEFYSQPGALTWAGRNTKELERLPADVRELVRIAQGLVIHQFVAAGFYGVETREERRGELHTRAVEEMLDRILALDDRPHSVARPPERRLFGVCRHFMVLLLAMLRAKGIPARGRSGFVPYFNPGFFEDHVIVEYWDGRKDRWALVDAQLDDVWRARLGLSQDLLDLPRDWFLTASEAWTRCRAIPAEASKFGTVNGGLRGQWFLGANLIHEVAGLNKMELLRWDVWGAMPRPGEALKQDQLDFFDRLAALTRDPDMSFDELRRLYENDNRVRVPAVVFNALTNQLEKMLGAA